MTKSIRDPFVSSQKEDAESAERARREYEFKEALKDVLQTRSGQTVIKRIFEESAFFSSAFDTNALAMARKEGKREFAQQIFEHVMKHQPEFFQTLREQDE